jgi:hypothetical protein
MHESNECLLDNLFLNRCFQTFCFDAFGIKYSSKLLAKLVNALEQLLLSEVIAFGAADVTFCNLILSASADGNMKVL